MVWMFLVFAAVFLVSLAGTRLVLAWLRHRAILDHPNERSSHSLPTPRGGGLAVTATVVLALIVTGPPCAWVVGGLATVLAVVSWADDLHVHGLPARWRLLVQIGAVAAALAAWPGNPLFFQGFLPPVVDSLVAGVLWVWFLNLFNFMDGIDGISGVETVTIGTGVSLVAVVAGLQGPLDLYGGIFVAAALGFLWWNWSPAKVFLGDVGSVPLGFLLGWLLLGLAARGQWAAALILPGYYLADATLTLLRRALRGERVWEAHREHAYQKAVLGGMSHSAVSGTIAATGAILVGLAVVSTSGYTVAALAGAGTVVGLLLFYLATRRTGRINAS